MATTDQPANSASRPDPTVLVTQAIEKSEQHQNEKNDLRFSQMEKLQDFLQKEIDARPVAVAKALDSLRELLFSELKKLAEVSDVRFAGIDKQFENGEKNLSLALTSAEKLVQKQQESGEKAIIKNETSMAEKINGLESLFNTSLAGLNTQISDVKERLDRGEGHGKGISDFAGWIFGGVGLIATLITIIGAIALKGGN